MVEAMPDSQWPVSTGTAAIHEEIKKGKGGVSAVSPRKILDKIALSGAELKKSSPLSFACRCSPERAVVLLRSMSEEELKSLPEKLDITCHMCGRVFTVSTRA
jgi:redox-regulated HSP33 family molecular chaperone